MELTEEKRLQLLNLEQELHSGIIGQPRAIASVSAVLRRGELNLTEPGRPKGTFLFLGPTGVGKTQLAKDFTRCLGGSDSSMAIFDMSEFQRPSAVQQLLGTRRNKGKFYEKLGPGSAVKTVVFDEVEKAHRPLLDLLLQVFDEGRVTLGDGAVLDFRERYVVLTSNLASESILKAQAGFRSSLERFVRGEARKFLRPELFGRIDLVEVFQPLTFAQRVEIGRMIAVKEIARLKALGESAEDVIGDTLLAMCAKDGDLGARPLRRKIHAIIQEAVVMRNLGSLEDAA